MTKPQQTARDAVREYVISQVCGSDASLPGSVAVNANSDITVSDAEKWLPLHDEDSGFPILQNDAPAKVFATGIIHAPDGLNSGSKQSDLEQEHEAVGEHGPQSGMVEIPDWAPKEVPGPAVFSADDPLAEDLALEQTQLKRPTAMGLTATLGGNADGVLRVTFKGALYSQLELIGSGGISNSGFRRDSFESKLEIQLAGLMNPQGHVFSFPLDGALADILEVRMRLRREVGMSRLGDSFDALTVVVAHKGTVDKDVFHCSVTLDLVGPASFCSPAATVDGLTDPEEQELAFLYRHVEDWGVGHGVSVEWDDSNDKQINTVYVPVFDQELLSTDIKDLSLNMDMLASGSSEEIRSALSQIVVAYENWISQESESSIENGVFDETSKRLIAKCDEIRSRLDSGLSFLFDESHAERLEAFRLMNRAMYLQQRNGRRFVREWLPEGPIKFPELTDPSPGTYGSWYPFQIGFILLALPGLLDPTHESREIVDLIYFPTGGGKTEAYLGLAALGMFHRRLQDPSHTGVDVLMRYTLRLLTVQQFERTAGLMAAMEILRRDRPETLGLAEFSIGVWLGGDTTANSRSKVLEQLSARPTSRRDTDSTPFVLVKCPWCAARFGYHGPSRQFLGYAKGKAGGVNTLRFVCPDRGNGCPYSDPEKPLPVLITDEDIYECRPSFVLGTVDKFARLTLVPQSRAIFNLDSAGSPGSRLPPNLIIQDELHLISGPLGSMVALYESAIDALCSRQSDKGIIRPKIIAATATTRNFEHQARTLYARSGVALFPQAASRANETFFSSVVRDANGVPQTATQYVGLFPGTLVSSQLATSQLAAVLSQAPNAWTGASQAIDFYSTSLWFFNSLKELGQTLTLMQSTVVALQRSMNLNRLLPHGSKMRYLEPIMELTGRISSSEVGKSLSRLGEPNSRRTSIHTCLASSIMEVGVDVPRLGLLTVLSQPKLTAQYIQVTGRVGRSRKDGPGLVLTLFNTSRSRDRSIYERFRVFHRMLYANVEALSVTPFAHQTMEKGLVGATMALYRAWSPSDIEPTTRDDAVWDRAVGTMRERLLATSNPDNLEAFEKILRDFRARWIAYGPSKWSYSIAQESGATDDASLALFRGAQSPPEHIFGDQSVFVPNSMRTVDGQTGVRAVADPYSLMKA
jgi:hypothetical protein